MTPEISVPFSIRPLERPAACSGTHILGLVDRVDLFKGLGVADLLSHLVLTVVAGVEVKERMLSGVADGESRSQRGQQGYLFWVVELSPGDRGAPYATAPSLAWGIQDEQTTGWPSSLAWKKPPDMEPVKEGDLVWLTLATTMLGWNAESQGLCRLESGAQSFLRLLAEGPDGGSNRTGDGLSLAAGYWVMHAVATLSESPSLRC